MRSSASDRERSWWVSSASRNCHPIVRTRVQRRSGILGYERHPDAPDPADLLLLQLEKLSLFERDAPADDPAGSRQKPQEGHDRGRLAGSRLADDAQ